MTKKKTSKKAPKKKLLVDWGSVHNLYKLGHLSLRAIAEQYKADHTNSQTFKKTVSAPAIIKEAKRLKWKKNLASKVQERTQEKLVNKLVNSVNQKTDEEIIEEASNATANVVVLHRKQIKALLEHEDALLKELKTGTKPMLVGEKIKKVKIDLKDRSIILKNITACRKERIILERQAHNISDDGVSDDKKVIRVRAMEID